MKSGKILKTTKAVKKAFPEGIDRLEIGSGEHPEPDYVHLDIQADLPDLQILSDARNMPIPDNFVSGDVRAVHVMEHFCHPEYAGAELIKKYGTTTEVIREVYRVLKPGGRFVIVTPDLDKIGESLVKNRVSKKWLQRWCVGGHNNDYDVHHWLWTKDDAERWLTEAGFKTLSDWNPIQGRKAIKSLDWSAGPEGPEWHKIEWYHWLFYEGIK